MIDNDDSNETKGENFDESKDDPLITETGSSFRDSVSNIDKKGNRVWVYPVKPKGQLYNWRMITGYFLLAVFIILPFIKIDGEPLVLLDVFNRKFIIFGLAFWPQDFFIFALSFLAFVIFIVLFTAIYGRLWCGWLCPQTVFMELVFRKVEYWIEGNASQQKKLDNSDWTPEKVWKKSIKHLIFLGISFFVISLLTSYITGIESLGKTLSSPFQNVSGILAIIFLALAFDFIFAKFREQACIYVCPYARLQSVLIDKNSLVVAYNNVRGEPRGKNTKNVESKFGDCIDCGLCVRVCPTGIDIRNGIQLECVNCAACIDACDSVMSKINRPKKLIKYASLNQIINSVKFTITPRIILYSVVLTVLIGFVSFFITTRADVEATILRAKGTIYQVHDNGNISNLYTAKIANKTFKTLKLSLKVENLEGVISIVGERELVIQPDKMIEIAFFVELPLHELHEINSKLKIGVYADGKKLESVKTSFSGPGESKHKEHKEHD